MSFYQLFSIFRLMTSQQLLSRQLLQWRIEKLVPNTKFNLLSSCISIIISSVIAIKYFNGFWQVPHICSPCILKLSCQVVTKSPKSQISSHGMSRLSRLTCAVLHSPLVFCRYSVCRVWIQLCFSYNGHEWH